MAFQSAAASDEVDAFWAAGANAEAPATREAKRASFIVAMVVLREGLWLLVLLAAWFGVTLLKRKIAEEEEETTRRRFEKTTFAQPGIAYFNRAGHE